MKKMILATQCLFSAVTLYKLVHAFHMTDTLESLFELVGAGFLLFLNLVSLYLIDSTFKIVVMKLVILIIGLLLAIFCAVLPLVWETPVGFIVCMGGELLGIALICHSVDPVKREG